MKHVTAICAFVALTMTGALSVGAQSIVVAARDSVTPAAEPGATVTTALRITNRGAASVTLSPRVAAPSEWPVPLGALPFELAAGETDSWIVSLRVPARSPAGKYVVALSATDGAGVVRVRDSIVVTVSAQRRLELSLTHRPTYAVSGETYSTGFLLSNRGNVATTVALGAVSVLGGRVVMDATEMKLAAGESQSLGVRVSTVMQGQESRDDVLELHATDLSDTSVTAIASARVTIVQKANASEPLHRVASQLRLRAADASAGVSPFELSGAGALRDGGSEQLSFVLRSSAGPASQFGDQDEYRIELRGTNYTARVGDGLYGNSFLTTSGQFGFGAGMELRQGALSGGAFAQRFRLQPNGPTERGVYMSARADDMFAAPRVGLTGVTRSGGAYEGKVLGTNTTLHPIGDAVVELEMAGSTGPLGRGVARTAHVMGGDRVRYDLSHIWANDNFAGTARGAQHDYATISTRPWAELQLTASTGAHRSSGAILGVQAPQFFRVSTLAMEYATRFSLQYSFLTRTSEVMSSQYGEYQRGVSARGEQSFGRTRIWGGAGVGTASGGLTAPHGYHELNLGASSQFDKAIVSLYGETSQGMAISRGADHLLTAGGDARLQIGEQTMITVNGFQTVVLSGTDRYVQLEAGVSRLLPTGSTVSLRVRIADNASITTAKQIAFLEYSMPLQMPVGRAHTAGRVRGRVIDQESGRGIAGALVRLGPQAAITDGEGRVAFAGLPAGEYRLSLAQQSSQAPTVFTGDPTVRVDSARTAPTTFALSIERAGSVTGTVRHMAVMRTGLEASPDSLADAGPLAGVAVALVGVRDTLFATTDVAGSFRFAEVTSGAWILKVITEAQAGTKWEPSEIDVDVKPGVKRAVSVRQVPRRRAVQMIPGDTPTVRK